MRQIKLRGNAIALFINSVAIFNLFSQRNGMATPHFGNRGAIEQDEDEWSGDKCLQEEANAI